MSKEITTESGSKIYQRLITYIVPYRMAFLLAILCNVAYGYIDTEIIAAFKPLLDGLKDMHDVENNVDFLTIAPIFIIIALILRGTVGFVATYCMSFIGNNMIMVMRKEIFARYLVLPAKFFDAHKTGELLSESYFSILSNLINLQPKLSLPLFVTFH